MNRRRFFGTFLGLVAAPSIIISAFKATPKIAGSELVLSSYPITLQCYHNISEEMSADIQKEMDREYLRTIHRIV